jgi:hypothetical protein
MGELRTRMIRDMTVRGFAAQTHTASLAAVVRLVKHYRRAPEPITDDEIQTYLACFNSTTQVLSAASARSGSAARFIVRSSAFRDTEAMTGPSDSAMPTHRHRVLARIDAALHAAGFDLAAGVLESFLDECVAARLVHRDGTHYLALALPTSASAAPG